jgi:hypothetical protein
MCYFCVLHGLHTAVLLLTSYLYCMCTACVPLPVYRFPVLPPQLDLDWAFQLKDGIPQLTRQSLIPGGSVELTHENLFGDSQSLSVSLSSSDWRNPAADLGFQMSYTEPFYAKNTTRNVQVGGPGGLGVGGCGAVGGVGCCCLGRGGVG